MPTRLQRSGDFATLFLDEPRGNALSSPTVERINTALDEIEKTAPRAVVVAGREKIFCGGLDLVEVAGLTEETLAVFVDKFEALFLRLLTFPIPLIAAIEGHALAGGAVIALACDHRVMKDGPYQIGLNEVEIGLPFPSAAFEIARFGLPPRAHTDAIAFGRRYDPKGALACGYVHELHDDPLARAHEVAARIASLGPDAVRRVREELRREFVERAHRDAARTRAAFVTAVRSEETMGRVVSIVESLKKKS